MSSPPASDTPHLPRQRRKEERPRELLDAALDLFVERGFAATRMEEISARAGVSKGTLYLYYPSKEELLKAVIRERLSDEIKAVAAEATRHQGSASDLLRSLFVQWWLRTYDGPISGVFKLIVTEVRGFPDIAELYFREVVEPGSQLIVAMIRRGIAAGEFREVDVDAAVHSLLLPMVMLCVHKHSLGACAATPSLQDPRAFVEQHVDIVVRGLAVTAAPSPRPRKKPR